MLWYGVRRVRGQTAGQGCSPAEEFPPAHPAQVLRLGQDENTALAERDGHQAGRKLSPRIPG